MQMSFRLPASASAYIDLALCASIVNRRGYKQENTNWAVSQFELFNTSASSTGTVVIQKLPETWVFDNAYTKSKALYDRMNDQVLDTEPDIQGKYHDFKIGMDQQHVLESIQDANNQTGKILTPMDALGNFTNADFNGAVFPVADWDFSKIEIPNVGAPGTTVGYTLHAVGADATGSKGIIAGYELSRSRVIQKEPNTPSLGGWMTELFDDGEQLDDIRENIVDDNDRPPYAVGADGQPDAYYPGGATEQTSLQVHSFCNFTSTTVSQKNVIMGGMFRNGLIKITNVVENTVDVILHLVPGNHRGYMVEEC